MSGSKPQYSVLERNRGVLAAVAGMVVMIRTNSLQPTVGDGLEFQAVVAAVLGGNSMKGGCLLYTSPSPRD